MQRTVPTHTPTRGPGWIGLLIRRYEEPLGRFSRHLTTLAPGSAVRARAPLGRYQHTLPTLHSVAMIAQGTGITPMLAILQRANGAEERGKVGLLHAQRAGEDWSPMLPASLTRQLAHYELVQAPARINEPLLRRFATKTPWQQIYMCGTDEFCDHVTDVLLGLSYEKEALFQF